MTWAGVTSLLPQQAWVPMQEYAGAEGAREENVPADQRPLRPLLPILLRMVAQSPDPSRPSYN